MSENNAPSNEAIEAYAYKVIGYSTGQYVSWMIHLGDRLGLYKALQKEGAVSSSELAEKTGLRERWLLEWLKNQAAAGLLNYDDQERFTLDPAAIPILIDENSPFYVAGFFHTTVPPEVLDHVAGAFQTGIGMSWDAHGPNVAKMVKRFSAPTHAQLPAFLSKVDGLTEKLQSGAKVVDIGCGAGVALRTLARSYPQSIFEGFDPSPNAVEMARKDTAEEGLSNITYHIARGEELPNSSTFDLALTLDCMHDMTFPQRVVESIRRTIKPDGVWVIKDIKSSANFAENLENPLASLFYGISVLYCMSAATCEPNGAGLGTMGFNPTVAEEMTKAGGFTKFEMLDIEEDPFNYYYAIRP